MKILHLLTFLCCAVYVAAQSGSSPTEPYSRIAILNSDEATLANVADAGIDLRCGGVRTEYNGQPAIIFECSGRELETLKNTGVETAILIDDVGAFYAQRAASNLASAKENLREQKLEEGTRSVSNGCEQPMYDVPEHFELGDMGGFLDYQQILDVLDSMASLYPTLITSRMTLSDSLTTRQGRPVYWVKISDHAGTNEDEPEVLYTALTHAREPASAMCLLYYMWYLLENYATDPEVQTLVDQTEMYFVPVLNPDGYIYNETTHPDGGGMWRKNMNDNNKNEIVDDQDGVDLNRNFSYLWGIDDSGSSPKPGFSTYRGTGPFSEPETQMLRNFVLRHDFVAAMHNHTYGNDLYHPWDHGSEELPDASLFYRISDLMTWHNRYHFGESYSTYWLGSINGGANDWFYGDQKIKPKIFTWIPEIGTEFWPDPVDIVSLCQRQMQPELTLARMAGQYGIVHDLSPIDLEHGGNSMTFRVENAGLHPGDFTISVMPLQEGVTVTTSPQDGRITSGTILSATDIAADVEVEPWVPDGSQLEFDVVLSAEDYTISTVHLSKVLHSVVALESTVENAIALWNSNTWGIDSTITHDGAPAITDSPGAAMSNDLTTIELRNPLSLEDVSWAKASFFTRWSIETNHDFVQLQVRINNGEWVPLCGRYSKPGAPGSPLPIPSPYAEQPDGQPIYDGRQNFWVREEIDLSEYAGYDNVELRFVAWSGGLASNREEDGFYFSDFTVYTSRKVHCANLVQDEGETGIDCGGSDCAPCPTCNDGVQNSDEEGIDCGGAACTPCPTCIDGVLNGDEEGVDCGGSACTPCPTCADGIQNGTETGVDCGGGCNACPPTCNDGIQNGDETGIDCGGTCPDICKTFYFAHENKIWYSDAGFDVTILPNPVSDVLQVSLISHTGEQYGHEDITWKITDMTGVQVDQGFMDINGIVNINVVALYPQLYVISIYDVHGRISVQRFLKQS